MLKDDLYRLEDLKHEEGSITAIVKLNPDHAIFQGHYPGLPVLPGACMIQMIKEVFEAALTQKLLLTLSQQLKFLQMVDPGKDSALNLSLTYQVEEGGFWKVSGTLSNAGAVALKFQGSFRKY